MGRQRFTPEQIIATLREVDVLVGWGSTAIEQVRRALPVRNGGPARCPASIDPLSVIPKGR